MPTSVRRWRLCLSAECGARLKGALTYCCGWAVAETSLCFELNMLLNAQDPSGVVTTTIGQQHSCGDEEQSKEAAERLILCESEFT